jgi:hypothetical protein
VRRIGVIHNRTSRHNRVASADRAPPPGVLHESPQTHEDLDAALARLAAAGLDLLVIDGGDGTIREVLTRAPAHFVAGVPPIAVLPSGKTNALALDLGAPLGWGLQDALGAAGQGRFTRRAPLEVTRLGAGTPLARGFIFGAGAYVRAIDLAQRAHRLGAFNSVAIGLTLASAALRTLLGGPRSKWRRGVPMRLSPPGAAAPRQIFLLLASTLKRLPLGLKPFGPPSADLRTLLIEAPPTRLPQAIGPLLRGEQPEWLEPFGYRRRTVEALDLHLDGRFVLDGEAFTGGELQLTRGVELEFVKP